MGTLTTFRTKVRRVFVILLLIAGMNSLGNSFFDNYALAAQQGESCAKTGLKSGSLICTKLNGKIIWQRVKKTQKISFTAPKQTSTQDAFVDFQYAATSKLAVTATSTTLDICSASAKKILLTGKSGLCRISLTQGGNSYYQRARAVSMEFISFGVAAIDFQLPEALLLSQSTYKLVASSSSGLPITFSTGTPDFCTAQNTILTLVKVGTCSVIASHVSADPSSTVTPITLTAAISNGGANSDQPDLVNGFQIKPIYVVPSDGKDKAYDTNGYIAGILDEGNKYLRAQIGLTVPIDKSAAGYDIQYLKSKLSTKYLSTHADATLRESSDAYLLLDEIRAMDSPGLNQKNYIFFIDVPGFGGQYCGFAATPGISSVVALKNISARRNCTGKSWNFDNGTANTWVHELFHNFGVKHTLDDPCDFMKGNETLGTCPSNKSLTIDKNRARYVRSSVQGQDILKLPVWEGYTNKDYWSRCYLNPVPRTDGVKYAYCPTGTQTIGALSYCWGSISSVSLEEFVDGAWESLGAGSHYSDPWGPNVSWKCSDTGYTAPWKQLTVTTPGVSLYRWMINGSESEQFKVIWVK